VEKLRSISVLHDLRFGLGVLTVQIEEAFQQVKKPAFHANGLFDEVALSTLESDCAIAKQTVADSLLATEEDAKIFLSDRRGVEDKEIAEALDLDCSSHRAQEMIDHIMALQASDANESELHCSLAKSALKHFNIQPLQAIGASLSVLHDRVQRELRSRDNRSRQGEMKPGCSCADGCTSTCQCPCHGARNVPAVTEDQRNPDDEVQDDLQPIDDSMARMAQMLGTVPCHGTTAQPGHTTAVKGIQDLAQGDAQLIDVKEAEDGRDSFRNEHTCTCCALLAPAYEAPCEHAYCVACLRQLLLKAILEPSLLPVRCCGIEFDENVSRMVLARADFDRFQTAWAEINASSKMYCPVPTCSQFINLDLVDATVFPCPNCRVGLCKECRAGEHAGMSCTEFQESGDRSASEEQRLIELGEQLGWKRCARCGTMVELHTGCNHMTCRCGWEFCYVCGVEWKSEFRLCTCEMFNEEQLLLEGRRRAEVVAHQQGIVHPARVEPIVQREIQRLRAHQECDQDCDWTRRARYGGSCEHCGFMMHHYHFFCRLHESRVCYVCKHHRI
jgi:hypothetical protein